MARQKQIHSTNSQQGLWRMITLNLSQTLCYLATHCGSQRRTGETAQSILFLPPCWCPDTDRLSGALSRDRLSARWTRSEPGSWVTVPEARACLQPRSCQWRCTGRWQTGRRWPPRSGFAGSGAFWLQEGKEGQMWKVEVSSRLCLFKSVCNFGPFPLFTFEEKNAFASKSFKDFIMPVKDVLERSAVFSNSQAFWDRTRRKEDILWSLLCKLS